MADQKRIKLYPFHATPKNVTIRELPVATPSAGTTIYLYTTHATPKNIIIRNPLVADAPEGGGTINATAEQTIEAVTQSASADLLIQSTASQTIAAVTQSVTADILVQATAAQTISAVTQSTEGDLLVQATAAQTIEAVTQAASGDAIINATADQVIDAVIQTAASTLSVAASATSAGSYNMYRTAPDTEKPKVRKVKYLGPAPQKFASKTSRAAPKATTKIPAYLADLEKGKLAARQSRGAKLRAMQMADDEWFMLN